jgi:hypothetical protein
MPVAQRKQVTHITGVNGQPEELLILIEGGSLQWVARAG